MRLSVVRGTSYEDIDVATISFASVQNRMSQLPRAQKRLSYAPTEAAHDLDEELRI